MSKWLKKLERNQKPVTTRRLNDRELSDALNLAAQTTPITGQVLKSHLEPDEIEAVRSGACSLDQLRCYAKSLGRFHTLKSNPTPTTNPQPNRIQCIQCQHFSRDTIGDGHGIGDCAVSAPQSKPRWPNALRYCHQFLIIKTER